MAAVAGPRNMLGEGQPQSFHSSNTESRNLSFSLERKQRLQNYGTQILFHGTTEESAEQILSTGKMLRGGVGYAGGGIYFAQSEEDAVRKNRKKEGNGRGKNWKSM